MRHVRAGVADPREHRDLAGVVQRGERRRRGVPAQPRVLGERDAGSRRQRQRRAELAVQGVLGRGQQRQRVDAARRGTPTPAPGSRTLERRRLGDPVGERAARRAPAARRRTPTPARRRRRAGSGGGRSRRRRGRASGDPIRAPSAAARPRQRARARPPSGRNPRSRFEPGRAISRSAIRAWWGSARAARSGAGSGM